MRIGFDNAGASRLIGSDGLSTSFGLQLELLWRARYRRSTRA
jgi:hypothetical protein